MLVIKLKPVTVLVILTLLSVTAPSLANEQLQPSKATGVITGVISKRVLKVYSTKRGGTIVRKKSTIVSPKRNLISPNNSTKTKPAPLILITAKPTDSVEVVEPAKVVKPAKVLNAIAAKSKQIFTPKPLNAMSANSLTAISPTPPKGFSINKPLTLNIAAMDNEISGVSPLGQWLSSGFSWIDSIFSIKAVKPWQKSILAEPAMSASGVSPVVAKFATKVFISKEATLGGNGVAGGGCGCK